MQSYLELLLSIRDIARPNFQQKAQLSSGHYIVRIKVHASVNLEMTIMFTGH